MGQAIRRDVEVVIPWREQPSRLPAFHAVCAWYEEHGFRTTLVDTHHEPFNLSACRNAGVTNATAPVVVIGDADTIPEIGPLNEAISAARTSGMTHLPYSLGNYRVLMEYGSRQFFDGIPLERCNFASFAWSCSGVYVTTPAAWASHYGHDELFTGWAPEDHAWRITHETLLGPVPRHEGHVYALTHDPAPKDYGYVGEGAARYARYERAAGDIATICGLASEYLIRSERVA